MVAPCPNSSRRGYGYAGHGADEPRFRRTTSARVSGAMPFDVISTVNIITSCCPKKKTKMQVQRRLATNTRQRPGKGNPSNERVTGRITNETTVSHAEGSCVALQAGGAGRDGGGEAMSAGSLTAL